MREVVEVRPHGSLWKVFEAPGAEPIFPHKEQALLYALDRTRSRSGEIHLLNEDGTIEKVIPFLASGSN